MMDPERFYWNTEPTESVTDPVALEMDFDLSLSQAFYIAADGISPKEASSRCWEFFLAIPGYIN